MGRSAPRYLKSNWGNQMNAHLHPIFQKILEPYNHIQDDADEDNEKHDAYMEESYCSACSGSGEGSHEGANCRVCNGTGEEWVKVE